MKCLATVLALAASLLLSACDDDYQLQTPQQRQVKYLPPIPADIQTCLRQSGITLPNRQLTVAEVEKLWKQDRLRIVVMRSCGDRLLAWYAVLRKHWR
jgi:hypothetical protein